MAESIGTALKNGIQKVFPKGTQSNSTNGLASTSATSSNGRPKRPIRIAGCSGGKKKSMNVFHLTERLTHFLGVYDRKRAIHDMAKNEDVDVITGDWMSEANMTLRGSDKREKLGSGTLVGKAYEPYFLEELDPAIPWLAKRRIKIAVNAGASDVQGLAEAVKLLIKRHGVNLKVGYVDGDDVTDAVLELYKKGKNY